MEGWKTSVISLMEMRSSWRTYLDRQLDDEVRHRLESFMATQTTGPFGSTVRFRLVESTTDDHSKPVKLGTYGIIKGASLFLVGAVKKSTMAMEDFGYCMETIILKATELELGTCWLGATFNNAFAEAIDLGSDELLPAVSPVGYAQQSRRLTDSVMRFFAGSKNRKAWPELFFLSDPQTPLTIDSAGWSARSLEMVRLGPSASNNQPWRVIKETGTELFHFYRQPTANYDRPGNPIALQRIDMGIALSHFDLSSRETGHPGSFSIHTNPLQHKGWIYCASWQPSARHSW